jgi:hypothetical protein
VGRNLGFDEERRGITRESGTLLLWMQRLMETLKSSTSEEDEEEMFM